MVSRRMKATLEEINPVFRFVTDSYWSRHAGEPEACDFTFGNPHSLPLPGVVEALRRWVVPKNKDWFGYKVSEPPARAAAAESLRRRLGLPFEDEDIFLTTGAFAGLSTSLCALVDPGDEVIFVSPPWFYYRPMILSQGGVPVRVLADPASFDLDLPAISAVISERTRAIIINSPHNPTGKIYPASTLEKLADLLQAASERYGRPIYLLSDEAYCRIVYDGNICRSPCEWYPHTLLIYTYGKTLLTPGQRMGYIALPPSMPSRDLLRSGLLAGQVVTGFAFPNALLQYALPELDPLSIDVGQLQARRDRMVAALTEMGYELTVPEATFYLVVRSPWIDDQAFCELLASHHILVLPGALVELPGYFRISLTASDSMVDRALEGFAAALRTAREQAAPVGN